MSLPLVRISRAYYGNEGFIRIGKTRVVVPPFKKGYGLNLKTPLTECINQYSLRKWVALGGTIPSTSASLRPFIAGIILFSSFRHFLVKNMKRSLVPFLHLNIL